MSEAMPLKRAAPATFAAFLLVAATGFCGSFLVAPPSGAATDAPSAHAIQAVEKVFSRQLQSPKVQRPIASPGPETLTNMPKLRHWLNDRCFRDKEKIWGGLYSPTYNFLFFRNAGKTGGTTVHNWIVETLCALLDERDIATTQPLFGASGEVLVKPGCAQHLRELGHMNPKGTYKHVSFDQMINNNTVIFSVVRNPCERASSAYYYLIDPRHSKHYKFVDFINNPLLSQHWAKTKTRRSTSHYMPQLSLKFDEQKLCGDGVHLLRLESLSEGMQEVIEHINRQRRPGVPPLPPFSKHMSNNEHKHRPFETEVCPGTPSCKTNMWYSPLRLDMDLLDYKTCNSR